MERLMKTIKTDLLEIAYEEYGSKNGVPLILLHGFPYDVHAYDEAARLLTAEGKPQWRIFVPWLRGYGKTRFLSEKTMRSGDQGALAYDLLSFMDALELPRAFLAGFDWGGRAACIVSALYPERICGLVSCGAAYNMHDPNTWKDPVAAEAEKRSWYVYYLNTERGYRALKERREEFCRFLWQTWSPEWKFTDEEYERSAASFANPDFADVVAHSYRSRIGEVPVDSRYSLISEACAKQPPIRVPSVALLGGSDGVTPPLKTDTAAPHFTGSYRREILRHVGHNVPQEAPQALVHAIMEVYGIWAAGQANWPAVFFC